jgi:hypothetical protein
MLFTIPVLLIIPPILDFRPQWKPLRAVPADPASYFLFLLQKLGSTASTASGPFEDTVYPFL